MQKKVGVNPGFFYFADTVQSGPVFLFCKHPVKHQKKKNMNQTKALSNTGQEQVAKPCTVKELAAMYNVSTKTIRKWLLPHQASIGPKTGWYFTTLQVRIIFERLGAP